MTLSFFGPLLFAGEDRVAERCEFTHPQVRTWSGKDFLRLRRDPSGKPVALETAIVRFAGIPTQGRQAASTQSRVPTTQRHVEVDLIGVVHLADPGYFRFLNNHFRQYEAVLYELVAPPEARFAPGEAPWDASWWGIVQRIVTGMLGLQFQLDGVNYKAANFVHADMTPEEFHRTMRDRGESSWQIVVRAIAQALEQGQPAGPGFDELWKALQLRGIQRQLALRRWAAEQFGDLELAIRAVEGPQGSTILSERNKVALVVLRRELNDGKRKLAIFYGAAHMPDLANRLQAEFGLKAESCLWLTAWDLSDPPVNGQK
ncbi:MAG: hypothetical protein NZ899_14140 [Thermoguttaceae bacterium]|nr:hypothetical protein [Thermoguttaceae bacterium]MDW8080125.1 hypothetical protein [Thermoguttaceae bacterium]